MTVFDPEHFAHMTGGDVGLQREVVGMFRAQVASWALVLAPESEPRACRAALHTLKGSARGIGLWVLAECCETAEAAFDPTDGDVAAALADVHAALTEALAALDAFEHG
ncbi:MAG TPA: Hpt domain-containing protein [Caulobacterales bacterium]|nr:Hpt domain-containing protein [Caulobacterales bacterium]